MWIALIITGYLTSCFKSVFPAVISLLKNICWDYFHEFNILTAKQEDYGLVAVEIQAFVHDYGELLQTGILGICEVSLCLL